MVVLDKFRFSFLETFAKIDQPNLAKIQPKIAVVPAKFRSKNDDLLVHTVLYFDT